MQRPGLKDYITAVTTVQQTSCEIKPVERDGIYNSHDSQVLRHIVVVVSGMQLLQLRSATRRHHPPQRVVLRQICCFGERKVVVEFYLYPTVSTALVHQLW